MKSNDTVLVTKADFESVAQKLGGFIKELKPNEKEIMAWMMGLAGWSPSLSLLSPHYRPRDAKYLVLGGADGLTVVFGRSGFKVIPPEGPLPASRASFFPRHSARDELFDLFIEVDLNFF